MSSYLIAVCRGDPSCLFGVCFKGPPSREFSATEPAKEPSVSCIGWQRACSPSPEKGAARKTCRVDRAESEDAPMLSSSIRFAVGAM